MASVRFDDQPPAFPGLFHPYSETQYPPIYFEASLTKKEKQRSLEMESNKRSKKKKKKTKP